MTKILASAVLAFAVFAQSGAAFAETFKPLKLKTLDGQKKAVSDFPGKATIVVFFFPTCTYCKIAMPHTQIIYEKYKDQRLSLVFVNVLANEDKMVAAWQAQTGYTAPVLVGASLGTLQKNYGLEQTPTHYLIDAGGTVLFKQAGHSPGDEKILEEHVQKALGL